MDNGNSEKYSKLRLRFHIISIKSMLFLLDVKGNLTYSESSTLAIVLVVSGLKYRIFVEFGSAFPPNQM